MDKKSNKPHKIILYGGTGQAKVVRPIIEYYGSEVVAVFDDTLGLKPPFDDVPLYHGFGSLMEWVSQVNPPDIGFVITIGNPHGNTRLKLHEKLVKIGFIPFDVIDPSAIVADSCKIGKGAQILAGSIIMPEVSIGRQCIVNTGASIDHECVIENGCEIAPGAILCGCVTMKNNSWVCAGATIIPQISIGENSVVGAGAVVTKDVKKNIIVAGIPARKIKVVKYE